MDAANAIPDLLVHYPGDMNANHAIIEVKASGPRRRLSDNDATSDLVKLQLFVQHVGYERAIFLVYGSGANRALATRLENLATQAGVTVPIELWFHSACGQDAQHVHTLNI